MANCIIYQSYIIKNISSYEAGLWQAICYINDYIVTIATGSFSIYLLPRLSSLSDKISLKKELINIYKIIIPITIVVFIIIYLFRDILLVFLYSAKFINANKYLLLQMVGSFFWVCKSPLMSFMFAKKMLKTFFMTELVFAFLYAFLTKMFIPCFQIQGIQLSYAITMLFYFLVSVILIYYFLRKLNINTPDIVNSNKGIV